MKRRLSGRREKPVPMVASHRTSRSSSPMIILGIDPSLRGTGFGVVKISSGQQVALAHGTITSPKRWEPSRCLAQIVLVLRGVVRDHRPTVCVMEGLFFAQNLKTALTMGQARGAALAAVAEAGLDIYEIAPRRMKQAIVGYGAAHKSAVARMVQRMLRLPEPPEPDAADALALALAHAQDNARLSTSAPRRI